MAEDTDRRTSIRQGYDELADAYADEREPSDGEQAAFRALRDRLGGPNVDPPTVLDAGCGAGTPVLEAFADDAVDAVGLDFSDEQLRNARERGPVIQGDLTKLPIRTNAIDAVTAFHSTIHVPIEQHAALYQGFARVLRPDGWLLASVGRESWTGTNPDWLDEGAAMHWSFPTLETTKEYLHDVGFSVVDEWVSEDSLGDGEWPFLLCRLTDPTKIPSGTTGETAGSSMTSETAGSNSTTETDD